MMTMTKAQTMFTCISSPILCIVCFWNLPNFSVLRSKHQAINAQGAELILDFSVNYQGANIPGSKTNFGRKCPGLFCYQLKFMNSPASSASALTEIIQFGNCSKDEPNSQTMRYILRGFEIFWLYCRDAQIRTEKSSFGDCCDAISPRPYTAIILGKTNSSNAKRHEVISVFRFLYVRLLFGNVYRIFLTATFRWCSVYFWS